MIRILISLTVAMRAATKITIFKFMAKAVYLGENTTLRLFKKIKNDLYINRGRMFVELFS